MGRYYVLVKRRGSRSWDGALPARPGVSLTRLKSVVRKNLKKGYAAKIVSANAIKRLIPRAAARKRRQVRSLRKHSVRRMRRHSARRRKRRATRKQLRALMKARRALHRRRRR